MDNFYNVVNQVVVDSKPLRQYFDEAMEFYDAPLEMKEKDIKRMLVNGIRHNSDFDYEEGIRQVHKTKRQYRYSNYKQYKNIILSRIADTYPFLESECNKQKLYMPMCK